MSTDTYTGASTKQQSFVERLLNEKDLAGSPYEGWTPNWDNATVKSTSAVIKYLLTLPNKQNEEALPGYYVAADDGTMIVVVANRAGTHTYAKRLVLSTHEDGRKTAAWEYAPGVGRTLAGLAPLTAQEAAEFGHLHGICVRCAKTLSDPVSALVGYGQTCAKHMGWAYPTKKAEQEALLAAHAA